MLKLSEIWTYPVKGLGGVSLQSATILQKGLEHDRRWMLINEDGLFLTQRTHPRMALFKTLLHNDHLEVRHGAHAVQIPFINAAHDSHRTKIWKDDVSVIPVNAGYDRWFSQQLGVRCRLVEFPEDNPRPVESGYAKGVTHVRLQDAFPFLAIGQSSLNELNTKLDTAIPMNRFRPNLVFTGGAPHEEDTWKEITIGDLPFKGTRQCVRCTVPAVDQDTGIPGKEPLRTLATYRADGNKILFGMNLIGPGHGEISVGDAIRVMVPENIR